MKYKVLRDVVDDTVEDGIAECYAEVEEAYSGTIGITSVCRCPKHNTLQGGTCTSNHMLGKAFDFDQLSSEANWDVANVAYTINPNWEIFLYYENEMKIEFKKDPDTHELPPRIPPGNHQYSHGHIGVN